MIGYKVMQGNAADGHIFYGPIFGYSNAEVEIENLEDAWIVELQPPEYQDDDY